MNRNIPLVQDNSVNSINTSLCAINRAIGQNGVPEVNVNVNYNVTDEVSADNIYPVTSRGVKAALDDLDVSSVGGDGKYISAISEIDGKINATETTMDSTPTDNSTKAVTSGGVKSAIDKVKDIMSSLPTDAVLHYSFDDVPDYPDGTADVRLLNNNTYDIQSTDYQFRNNSGATFSNQNGNLQVSITGGTGDYGCFITSSVINDKILKFKLNVTSITGTLRITNGVNPYNTLKVITKIGEYIIEYQHNNTSQYPSLYFLCNGTGNSCTFTVEKIYIGDGSYLTPVIDNANGQNNATNNGGIATKGVSGKGAYFLPGKNANIGTSFQLNANFSVSLWIKPDNNTLGLNSNIISRDNQFILHNGASWGDYLMIYLYGKDSVLLSSAKIGSLLTPNVWTNVIITRNELTCKCYINGINVKTFTLADNTISQSTKPLYICGNSRPQSIDDFLIFNRALSENEVMALYLNKANTPKYYSWADWKLNQMENANRSIVAETRNIEEPPIEESGEEER